MNARFMICSAVLAVSAAAAAARGAAADPECFPRYKQARISAAAARSSSPALMKLDQDFYQLAGSVLSDLRVFTLERREVPFVVERAPDVRPLRMPAAADAKLRSRTGAERSGGELIVFEIPDELQEVRSLEVIAGSRDFERIVRVEAGPDGESWQLLREQALFDVLSRPGLRKTSIALRPTQHRFIRLTVRGAADGGRPTPLQQIWRDDPGLDPAALARVRAGDMRVSGLRAIGFGREPRFAPRPPESRAWPAAVTRVENRDEETVIGFDAGRAPLHRLELRTDTPFFYRRAALYGDGGDGVMRLLTEGTVMRLSDSDAAALTFAESRCRAYELRIRNGSRSPLLSPGVRVFGPVYQVVLPFPAAETLRLYFGAPAPLPDYGLQGLLTRRHGGEVVYRLEKRRNNPGFRPRSAGLWDRRQTLVAAAWILLSAGAVLGWALFFRGRLRVR